MPGIITRSHPWGRRERRGELGEARGRRVVIARERVGVGHDVGGAVERERGADGEGGGGGGRGRARVRIDRHARLVPLEQQPLRRGRRCQSVTAVSGTGAVRTPASVPNETVSGTDSAARFARHTADATNAVNEENRRFTRCQR